MPAAPHEDFDEMMPHTIGIRHNTASPADTDKWGKRQHAGGFTTYKCLWDDTVGMVRSSEGESKTYSRTAYVNTDGNPVYITDDFQFTDGVDRPVVDVQTHYDTDGAIHSVTVRFS